MSLAEQDRAVARMLAEAGVAGVTERRVKGWRVETYLGPPPNMPREQADAHWQALARRSGRGHGANLVAVQLAAEGFGCERLRVILRDLYGAGRTVAAMLGTVPGARGDEPAERFADGIDAQIDQRSDPLAAAVRRVRGRLRGRSTDLSVGREDEDAAWLTFTVASVEMLLGERPDDEPGLFNAAFDGQGAPAEALMADAAVVRDDVLRIIETVPLHILAALVQGTVPIARRMLTFVGMPPTEPATVALAAAMAPFLWTAVARGLMDPLSRAAGIEPPVLVAILGLRAEAALGAPEDTDHEKKDT